MGSMTIFTSAWFTPGTSVLRDVDRRGLQLAGRARVGDVHMPARGGAVRMPVEVHARGMNASVKPFQTPVVIGAVDGEVGPHPGRPPI